MEKWNVCLDCFHHCATKICPDWYAMQYLKLIIPQVQHYEIFKLNTSVNMPFKHLNSVTTAAVKTPLIINLANEKPLTSMHLGWYIQASAIVRF